MSNEEERYIEQWPPIEGDNTSPVSTFVWLAILVIGLIWLFFG